MSKEELKTIIDEALDTDSVVEAKRHPEVAVYTQVWCVDFKQIDEIRAQGVNLTAASAEGFYLTLKVRL